MSIKSLFFCITLLIILSVSKSLRSQSIDLQIRRLEYIQKALETKEAEIEQTQRDLNRLNLSRDRVEKSFQVSQQRIRELSNQETEIVKSILAFEHQADLTDAHLTAVYRLWQRQFQLLYRTSLTEKKERREVVESLYFPLLIKQTATHIKQNRELMSHIKTGIDENRATQSHIVANRRAVNRSQNELKEEIGSLQKQITELEREEDRIYSEYRDLENNRTALENVITLLQSEQFSREPSYKFSRTKLIWPLKGEVINFFGEHRDQTFNFVLRSNGIDILTSNESEVLAVDFGTVVFAEWFKTYGRMIIIDHQNGYLSLYSGLSRILVTKNDSVEPSQPIAITGKRANSDEHIVHFELRRNNVPVDPLLYLEE